MDRARMSAIMNAEKLEVTVKSRYWCIFPVKLSFVFISEFFSNEVMLFKAIFIHLFSHFLDHEVNLRYFPNQKCHDSNHDNSCNDSSSGFLRHKLLPEIVFDQSFKYRLPLNYFSFEPMDQPCASETWSPPQSGWPKKIRSSCTPRVCYKEIFTDWISKEPKPYCI